MGLNAQTTVPTFTSGQVLTAEQQNQSARTGVPVFETTTTRDAGFGGSGEKTLAEGQVCYIEAAPNRLQVYDGATWRPIEVDSWTSFTPVITAATGTITAATASANYTVIGKTVIARFKINITNNGTGGTAVVMTLPFAQNGNYANNQTIGVARESAITGQMLQVGTAASGVANIFNFQNQYPGATNAEIIGTYVYEVA